MNVSLTHNSGLLFRASDRPAAPERQNFDAAAFRQVMRELAAGVAIVAAGQGAARNGCTITSLASLSLAPPTLLISLAKGSSTLASMKTQGAFAVSLLPADRQALADRFSGRDGAVGAERFEVGEWIQLVTGAPVLAEALAAFDCRVEETIERHSHVIVLGAVRATRIGPPAPALVHRHGAFAELA